MDHEFYFTQERRAATLWEAFQDLELRACYEDQESGVGWSKIPLKRGELLVSIQALATRWRWSRGKVRRFLKSLQDEHEVVLKTDSNPNHKWTVLTLCLYCERQDKRTSNGHQVIQQTDIQRTHTTIEPSEQREQINKRNGTEAVRRFEDFPSNGNGHQEPIPPGTYVSQIPTLKRMMSVVQSHWHVPWFAADVLANEVASLVRAGESTDRILEVWAFYVRTIHDPAKINVHWFVTNYNQHQANEARHA
jgi:hypothetical protein